MNATAVRTENDGRQWFAVTFEDGETETYGVDTDGTMLDVDGCPVDDMGNIRNIAARNAVESVTTILAADTISGVYVVDEIPVGERDHGDDLISMLRSVADGDVIYATVSAPAAARIAAEYGIH